MSGIEGVAAQAAHVLTCTRCRMGWECGGLSEDDYANGARILPILDGGVVECGVCHCMVSADSVSWCFTSDEEGEYAVCPSCESGPLLSAEPNYIVMGNAVRQIVRGGLFPSYAAADAAGVIDALAVPGIQCNLTTTDRLAEVVESLTLDIHHAPA